MAALTAASRPPLRASIPSQYSMSGTAFAPSATQAQSAAAMPFSFTASPAHERNDYPVDAMHQSYLADSDPDPLVSSTILIRKLARNMTDKELRSMFLFAKDFVDSEFVTPNLPEDQGYVSAVARFKTMAAAEEAKAMLDGKPNTATEAHMIVEILPSMGMGGSMAPPNPPRRNTVDGTLNRGPSRSASSSGSMAAAANARHATRFHSTFQGMDRISPGVNAGHGGTTDFPFPQTASHIQSLFMPQSPVGAVPASDAPRVTGKSVINDDSVDDDETGELLKDPLAYAKNGQHGGASGSRSRRPTNPQIPVSRFASLSLTTSNLPSAGVPAFVTNGRNGAGVSMHAAGASVGMNSGMGGNASYNAHLAAQPFARPNYPPVNPADQNPPCNTLYVGNLPIDTSEDELKAMFSKQRGYKRLCFRTKQNGPMCFVEFEDVSFATKALNELYGHPLHNSVKGGIRLSFSKNPLGVRTGQPAHAPGLPLSMNAHHSAQALKGGGVGVMSTAPFMSASGPPPGLAAPPGLQGPMMSYNHTVTNGAFSSAPGMTGLKGPSSTVSGGVMATGPGGLGAYGGAFPDYMMGR